MAGATVKAFFFDSGRISRPFKPTGPCAPSRSGVRIGAMKPLDHGSLLKGITSSLKRDSAGDGLTGLLRRVRNAAPEGSLELGGDPELRRFLWRLGILNSTSQSATSDKAIVKLVDGASRATGEPPAVTSVKLRLFASGAYGVVPEPVCGDAPRCGDCTIAESCRYAGSQGAPIPDGELPEKRLAAQGADALSTSELLSIVLKGRGKDAEALAAARKLLAEAGSLRALATMSVAELVSAGVKGRGVAARLMSALALAQRTALESREPGDSFATGDDVFRYFRPRMRDLKKERFFALFLDTKNRLLASEQVSEGSLAASPVGPREIFGPALRLAASGVIFVHNHPSGDPMPSREDIEVTLRLQEAGRLLGVRVLDHIIVGESDFTSFMDSGLLA